MTQRRGCTITRRLLSRRLAGLSFAATALALTLGGAAKAGYVSHPDCAVFTQSAPVPKWNDRYFGSLTQISASADGVTGVFFLTGPQGKLVLKFEDRVNVGAVVARRMLKSLGVPSDGFVVDYRDAKSIKAIFQGMVKAARNNRALVPGDKAARFDYLVGRLQLKFDGIGGATPPQQLVITEFLPAFEGAESFGSALYAPDRGATGQRPDAQLKQFFGAAKALSLPVNQRLLGYLYVTDILLGNHDRLVRSGPNLSNIFLAAGTNGTPCLVAIDNEAHAPSRAYMATAEYAFRRRAGEVLSSRNVPLVEVAGDFRFLSPAPAGSFQFIVEASDLTREYMRQKVEQAEKTGVPIQDYGRLMPVVGEEIRGAQRSITGPDYLEALMGYYEDEFSSVRRRYSGPRNAFDGTALIVDGFPPDTDTTTYADTCIDLSGEGPGMLPGFVRRHLRTELIYWITGNAMAASRGESFEGGQVLGGGLYRTSVGSSDSAGRAVRANQLPDFNSYQRICRTQLAIIEADDARAGMEVSIDWKAFDRAFRDGVTAAMADIGNRKDMAGKIDAALKGIKLPTLSDVSREGLLARATFMAELTRGTDVDTIMREMVGGRLKGDYSKSATIKQDNYVWLNVRGKELWVPK